MTTEQQRKMLEAAAKACGFKKWRVLTSGLFQVSNNENWNEAFAKWTDWNPPHQLSRLRYDVREADNRHGVVC